MKILYSDQSPVVQQPSVFLAGPTPRAADNVGWRPAAIKEFEDFGFTGQLLVPEPFGTKWSDYQNQIRWEEDCLEAATVILFWVPRELSQMPALTTNVEFGEYLRARTDAVVYGRPPNAPNNRYLDWKYEKKKGMKPYEDLSSLVAHVVCMCESRNLLAATSRG